jgi:NTP pyrophosphatase (non-canonical NTP hydrolase)
MIAMLLAMLAPAKGGYEPPPQIWYNQATGCAASAMAAKNKDKEATADEFAEAMTWGFILADAGRKAGRTRKQVDSDDLESAMPFYRHLKEKKPPAFAAHRAYCKALLDADRP